MTPGLGHWTLVDQQPEVETESTSFRILGSMPSFSPIEIPSATAVIWIPRIMLLQICIVNITYFDDSSRTRGSAVEHFLSHSFKNYFWGRKLLFVCANHKSQCFVNSAVHSTRHRRINKRETEFFSVCSKLLWCRGSNGGAVNDGCTFLRVFEDSVFLIEKGLNILGGGKRKDDIINILDCVGNSIDSFDTLEF